MNTEEFPVYRRARTPSEGYRITRAVALITITPEEVRITREGRYVGSEYYERTPIYQGQKPAYIVRQYTRSYSQLQLGDMVAIDSDSDGDDEVEGERGDGGSDIEFVTFHRISIIRPSVSPDRPTVRVCLCDPLGG